jgi:subtilisin family serine protease
MTRRTLAILAPIVVAAVAAPTATAERPLPDDRYIVVLDREVDRPGEVANSHERRYEVRAKAVFHSALIGYAAEVPSDEVAELRADDRVAYVEPDSLVEVATTQENPTWGLDRIDERGLPLNDRYRYDNTGSGVTAYIIDTGIRPTHSQFDGRAEADRDFVDPDHPNGPHYNDGKDCNGHGTHVAGTVGGERYGVAKQVSLVGVRVLDCEGFGLTSEVIDGIDWVKSDHQGDEPAVANLSLAGGRSDALDGAVRRAINDGVSFAVAAGNGNFLGVAIDACKSSPARVENVMTVAASTKNDERPGFSNFGDCVDWFAPGKGIKSAWHESDDATMKLDGTSMASPHTAGVAALYLDDHSGASPNKVQNELLDETTKNKISSAKSENNHLLYTDF